MFRYLPNNLRHIVTKKQRSQVQNLANKLLKTEQFQTGKYSNLQYI